MISEREKRLRIKCRDEFPYYAEKCLKIRTKSDGIQPLVLNDAQQFIHDEAEDMLKEVGCVRIIVLKGRQQGASTYIEGRFYWKVTHQKGVRAFILTHEGEATKNLFELAKRYHDKNNPLLKPEVDKDSGNELHFNRLDSGYRVGTAGSKDVGRSGTVQYFHGSEVAFWDNARHHARGVMQSVPKGEGEEWLESTSDGVGNYFYDVWRLAEQGKNGFRAVFVPWFWQSEYRSNAKDFERDNEEIEYADLVTSYHDYDLSDEQLMFRREKINGEFGGETEAFKREYPATPQEAFESAGYKQLISTSVATKAIEYKELEPIGALVLGVDCARYGDDRTVIYRRQGRVAERMLTLEKKSQMEITGYVKKILDAHHYHRCFIDVGMGVGVIDRLEEMGYDQVQAVDFGSKALDPDKYPNKRNEIFGELAEWIKDGPVFIDDCDEEGEKNTDQTLTDICSINYKFDSKGRKVMESKDDTKKRLGHSPDAGDALALTFTEPVSTDYYDDEEEHYEEVDAMGY